MYLVYINNAGNKFRHNYNSNSAGMQHNNRFKIRLKFDLHTSNYKIVTTEF